MLIDYTIAERNSWSDSIRFIFSDVVSLSLKKEDQFFAATAYAVADARMHASVKWLNKCATRMFSFNDIVKVNIDSFATFLTT